MVTISLSAAGAKKAAHRLREFLAADGISLKQTHAYEALAQALGYTNWNTLQALLGATALPESAVNPAPDEKPGRKTVLSENLQQSLHRAIRLASERHHEHATLEHLLLSLAEDQDALSVLRGCGVDVELLHKDLTAFIDSKLDALVTAVRDKPKPTASFQRVVQFAVVTVLAAKRDTVSGADVLVTLLYSERESSAVQFLQNMSHQDAVTFISGGVARPTGPDPA